MGYVYWRLKSHISASLSPTTGTVTFPAITGNPSTATYTLSLGSNVDPSRVTVQLYKNNAPVNPSGLSISLSGNTVTVTASAVPTNDDDTYNIGITAYTEWATSDFDNNPTIWPNKGTVVWKKGNTDFVVKNLADILKSVLILNISSIIAYILYIKKKKKEQLQRPPCFT